jgi:hypothetical protein
VAFKYSSEGIIFAVDYAWCSLELTMSFTWFSKIEWRLCVSERGKDILLKLKACLSFPLFLLIDYAAAKFEMQKARRWRVLSMLQGRGNLWPGACQKTYNL